MRDRQGVTIITLWRKDNDVCKKKLKKKNPFIPSEDTVACKYRKKKSRTPVPGI